MKKEELIAIRKEVRTNIRKTHGGTTSLSMAPVNNNILIEVRGKLKISEIKHDDTNMNFMVNGTIIVRGMGHIVEAVEIGDVIELNNIQNIQVTYDIDSPTELGVLKAKYLKEDSALAKSIKQSKIIQPNKIISDAQGNDIKPKHIIAGEAELVDVSVFAFTSISNVVSTHVI